MPDRLIDIGANLTHESFSEDLNSVLKDASLKNINQLIVTGADLRSSEDAYKLAKAYPNKLYSTAGIHPHHAEETNPDIIDQLRQLALMPEVKAIGETGLDFFRDISPRPVQIASFESHIELAIETGLPMFLHERDSYPAFKDVLHHYRDRLSEVVVHCFTGGKEALHAYLDLDCSIGITGWICDERRGQHLIPLLRDIPAEKLMIETDSPYLMPRTIRPKPKTRRNEPKNLSYICEFIANILDKPYEDIASQTTSNAINFFRLLESNDVDSSQ
ncbi:MAG: TatD DNase family protein [Candidatus Azotimanducaceae bacterium]|jgi:TatD DNase family protein